MRFFALLSCLAALAFAGSSPSVACQWTVPSEFWGTQANGFAVRFNLQQNGPHLQGAALYAHTYQRRHTDGQGSADGSIGGNFFSVTAYWGPKSVGVYEGNINGQGRIDGTTYDKRNPNSRAAWNSDILLACQ